jgi:hypothetical protein
MGLDLHRKSWHLTIRTQLRKMSLQPQWSVLQKARETVTTIKATFVLFEAYLRRGSFSEKFSGAMVELICDNSNALWLDMSKVAFLGAALGSQSLLGTTHQSARELA